MTHYLEDVMHPLAIWVTSESMHEPKQPNIGELSQGDNSPSIWEALWYRRVVVGSLKFTEF